jgi:phospholipid/cholesterol/gamma-HCH transport system permease protein
MKIPCPKRLDQTTGKSILDAVRASKVAQGGVITLDLSGTSEMDSRGCAWIIAVARFVAERQAKFQCEGQTGSVAEFVEMIEPTLVPDKREETVKESLFSDLGGRVYKAADELRDFGRLLVDAIYWLCIAPFEGRGFRWNLWVDEMYEMGVRAVRINCLMNFLLGLIIAMLSAAQVSRYGLGIFVANLIVIGFARELAVIMTSTVVSARTGAAIAAELATMRVQEEIDALRGMGLNVSQFLVAPKILSLLICMPCLTALGMVSGVLGGSLWGIFILGYSADTWMKQTMSALQYMDIFQGMLKSLVFGLTIVLVGCHNGLRVSGGSRGVGLMTTRAVVMDVFCIIVIDIIFATIFYYVLDVRA